MGLLLNVSIKLKPICVGASKASLNRAPEFDVLDPKPGDLGMTRMKVH